MPPASPATLEELVAGSFAYEIVLAELAGVSPPAPAPVATDELDAKRSTSSELVTVSSPFDSLERAGCVSTAVVSLLAATELSQATKANAEENIAASPTFLRFICTPLGKISLIYFLFYKYHPFFNQKEQFLHK
jgi:hypothetical protein